MSKIVEDLRSRARGYRIGGPKQMAVMLDEAADRIAQLEAELTIQYQDGRHDGYEKGCTVSTDTAARYDRIEADNKRLRAALRPLACTCKARHQADCSRSEVDCPFWTARAALEERT